MTASTRWNHTASSLVIANPDEPSARTRRVAVVDDHPLLSHALAAALGRSGFEARTVEVSTPEAILEELHANAPDLVLLDVHLIDGVCTARELVRPLVNAGVRVLLVTASPESVAAAECIEAGALGVVGKQDAFDDVLEAIATTDRCGRAIDPLAESELLSRLQTERHAARTARAPFEQLTGREREVLEAIAAGMSASEIAERSYVALATVRSQIRSILMKLGVSSQLAAVARARSSGWLERDRTVFHQFC